MENLILRTQTMSSLQVAEITGKQHAHVMRDIRNLLEQGVAQSNFGLGCYTDANGQERPCFNLTKKGCLILASGYDAKLREKIIDRWEELEIEKQNKQYEIPKTYSEALMLAAQQAKELEEAKTENNTLKADNQAKDETIELQQKELAKAAPKVEYVDNVLQSVNTYATNLIAKEMGMSAETLNRKLKEKGIIYKQSGVWLLTHKYQNKGYTKTRTHQFTRSDGSVGTSMLTVWTECGRAFLHNIFSNN